MLTTQISLIARLHDPEDHEAWHSFVELYYPVIVNSLRAKGLQHADAQDTAQQVLISISRSLSQRPHDPDRARFRTWLSEVIRNAALNALQRVPKDRAFGGSDVHDALQAIEVPVDDESLLLMEQKKQLLRMAAQRIEGEFASDTWQAFWRTAIDGQPVEQVARDLGKQPGSVYAARSRIMHRLRIEIERLEAEL